MGAQTQHPGLPHLSPVKLSWDKPGGKGCKWIRQIKEDLCSAGLVAFVNVLI